MSKATLQRDLAETKENQSDNKQTSYVLIAKKSNPDHGHKLSNDLSTINVVEAYSSEESRSSTIKSNYEASSTTSSDFQDADCGEPMKEQIIHLDFTPIEGVDDNEAVYKKCQSFWTFLKEHRELHPLKVVPEKDSYVDHHKPEQASTPSEAEKSDESNARVDLERDTSVDLQSDKAKSYDLTAVDWVKRQDIMSNAIKTLEHKRYCDLPFDDYCESSDIEQREKNTVKKRRSRLATVKTPSLLQSGSRSNSRSKPFSSIQETRRTSLHNVEELMSQMKEWDLRHTKNFDRPHFLQEMSQMTMLKVDKDESVESQNVECCKLTCVPECPAGNDHHLPAWLP